MTKRYKLTAHGGFLLDREPFLVADNEELELRFETDYRLDSAYIRLRNGETERYDRLTDPYNVPRELLRAGKLEVQMELMAGGACVKRFLLESILIRESDGKMDGAPELQDFLRTAEDRAKRAEDAARRAAERCAEMEKQVQQAIERIEMLEKHYDPLAI